LRTKNAQCTIGPTSRKPPKLSRSNFASAAAVVGRKASFASSRASRTLLTRKRRSSLATWQVARKVERVPPGLGAAAGRVVAHPEGDLLFGSVLDDGEPLLLVGRDVAGANGGGIERADLPGRPGVTEVREPRDGHLDDALTEGAARGARDEAKEIARLVGLEGEGTREPVLRHAPVDVRMIDLALELEPGLQLHEVLPHRLGARLELAREIGLRPRSLLDEGGDDPEEGVRRAAFSHRANIRDAGEHCTQVQSRPIA
jgi:hypothetical protein